MKRIILPALILFSAAAFAQEKPIEEKKNKQETNQPYILNAEESMTSEEKEKIREKWIKQQREEKRKKRQNQRRENIGESRQNAQHESPNRH